MDSQTRNIVVPQLIIDEGRRRFPYKDTATPPKITIGIGRNLSDEGISDDEINYLFERDLAKAVSAARSVLGADVYENLSPARKAVIINMAFNLGATRLSKFFNTIAAIRLGNFKEAAREMRSSKWYKQVGNRAERLAKAMEQG